MNKKKKKKKKLSKRNGGVAQMVEALPSNKETVSSKPSTAKNNKDKLSVHI
jgi:hypothetical protein